MRNGKTLFEARWIVPVEPAGKVLENHALVVEGDRISMLAPASDARTAHPDAERVVLDHHVLLPGLVNAHTHAAMSLLRGYADDLPLAPWLQEHIWPAERTHVSAQFVRDGTALALAESIRGGVTCIADQYFFADAAAEVCHQARIRACLGMVVIDFPSAYADGPDEYIERGIQVHDRWKQDPLLTTMFAPHSTYAVSTPVLERIARLADELDVPVHLHLHETAAEVQESVVTHGQRPLAILDGLGMVRPGLMAVHMTQVEPDEIALLAAKGAHVVHCPQSNQKLANGDCPAGALRAAGVNVALGTDGAASNNDLDMFEEMRFASLLAKSTSGDATTLSAHETLRMATLDGARALGLAEETGSLVPGKAADFIAVRMDAVEAVPVYDAASALVYATGRHQVSDVWVAGTRLLEDRRLLTLDMAHIVERAHHWAERIR